jgi:hypothetical protein
MTSTVYSIELVTPAMAGIQNCATLLGPGFRLDDAFFPLSWQLLVVERKYLMLKA